MNAPCNACVPPSVQMETGGCEVNKREVVRKVLASGPATSGEVSAETGLSVRYCSAVLNTLWKMGRVERSDKLIDRPAGPGAYLYALPTKEWTAWTQPEIAKLRSMAGKPASEVAKALRRSIHSVRNQARRHGVELDSRNVNYWPASVRMSARVLRSEGLAVAEISDRLAVPLATVKTWITGRVAA